MRSVLSILAVVGVLSARADALPVCPEAWDYSPFDAKAEDGTIAVRSGACVLSTCIDGAFSDSFEYVADVTPAEVSPTKGWSHLGIACLEDDRNFWCLSLVRAPTSQGGRRFVELSEMREGVWGSQGRDGLTRLDGGLRDGRWEVGRTYLLKLNISAEGVKGEVCEKDGKPLWRDGYRFDGPAVRGGRPGFRCEGGHAGRLANLAVTGTASAVTRSGSAYPGAMGFFRVERQGEGWRVVDPSGRTMRMFGVDHVRYEGMGSRELAHRRYLEHNRTAYARPSDWEAETLARLKDWGFNLLGTDEEPALRRRGLAHTKMLRIGDELTRGKPSEWWICAANGKACSSLPNMFHPDFPAWCESVARRHCALARNDPWLFGYFLDNELAWHGLGDRQTGLWDCVLKLAPEHPARQALQAYAKGLGVVDVFAVTDREVKSGFVRLAAERYFAAATAAVRRYDPNHLILGIRFAGLEGAPDVVWEVAGKHCDVISVNDYPAADLSTGEIRTWRKESFVEKWTERQRLVGRPMFLSEWSFVATDAEPPCKHGPGQRFKTQAERARAAELLARTVLSMPFMVGYDFFMWVDDPPEGFSAANPEDGNYGLVSERGVPYPIADALKNVQRNAK